MATLTCPIPSNINPLSPNGYKFTITKIPEVEFFCQEVNLPEISLGSLEQATPFSDAYIPGDKLTYGELTVQFLVDEEMINYTAIYNWIVALGFPKNYEQYTKYVNASALASASELSKNYSDALLQILNNSNNPIKTIQFRDIFPTSLGSLSFLSTSQDVQYLVGNASFRFTYYEFMA